MKNVRNHSNDRKGFTLIELIVVVIIVGVLASIALPQYAGFIERARCTEAVNAIGAIRVGVEAYHMERGIYITANSAALISSTFGVTVDATNWTYWTSTATGQDMAIRAFRTAANGGTTGLEIRFSWTYPSQSGVWGGDHPNRPR